MQWTRLITVVALAVLAASCANPTSTLPPGQQKSILLVGDSISFVSTNELVDVFGAQPGWRFSPHAVSGYSVANMRDAIRQRADLHPDVMIIELGSNDMGGVNANNPDEATKQARYAEAIVQMQGALDDMAGLPCIVWVNVNTWSRIYDGQYDLRTWGLLYNEQLLVEAAARPNLHVVDYADVILAKGLPWLAANFDQAALHPETTAARKKVAEITTQGVREFCHP